MKYNQYSYLSVEQKDILKELKEIGFDLPTHLPENRPEPECRNDWN